jgi:hypothetical protein
MSDNFTDEEMRALIEWKASGGDHHGPNVETVTMPLAKYVAFRIQLLQAQSLAARVAPNPCTTDDAPQLDRGIVMLLGWPKDRPKFYVDILYPNSTRIDESFDYIPLYGLADAGSSP